MKLQILGTGCARCNALTMATEKAAQSLGLQYELEKVTDLKHIMSFGVMTTPALVVDGQVKVSGKVPAVDEIKSMLQQTEPMNNQTNNETFMNKHPKLSLAIALLVVIGAALVIAQTNRPVAVTQWRVLPQPHQSGDARQHGHDQCAGHDQRAGNPAGKETAAQTARSRRGQMHSVQNDGPHSGAK